MPGPPELPPGTPDEVVERAARDPRVPVFDPRVGGGEVPVSGGAAQRLVVLGDSLSHGFQSGAIFNTSAVVSGADRPRAGVRRLPPPDLRRSRRRPADQPRVHPARPRAALRHRGRLVGAAGRAGARARPDGRDRGPLGAGRGPRRAGRARHQPRAGDVRLEPARPGHPHREQPGGRDQAAEGRLHRPARREREPARGPARLSALRCPDAGDDPARRGAGAGRRRRHRDPGRLPRRQQRARHGDRSQGGVERRRGRGDRVAPGGLPRRPGRCCAPRSSGWPRGT